MKIAFLDLEFTRKPYDTTFVNEIIEMSCISCDLDDEYYLSNDGYITSSYKFINKKNNKLTTLVKPTINTFVTKEIAQYTGINTRELETEGIHLEEAINLLYSFIKKNEIVRIYIYSRYSKDLLLSAKKILRGRLDKKLDYIINILKDISYYSSIARQKLSQSIIETNSFEIKYCKEKLITKKKFSLNDTYLILLNKKEVLAQSKIKSLSDAFLIKDIFFSENRNLESELSELAYKIELKRENLYNFILSKKDMIDWICTATDVEELKRYKNESLDFIIKNIIYFIKDFKMKIIDKSNIKVNSINKNDKWLTMYASCLDLATGIKSSYGLKIKSVKDCIEIMNNNEIRHNNEVLDAKATSILMETGDDFEKFKIFIATLDKEMLEILMKKCKEFLSTYDNGHAFRTYKAKLEILSDKLT